VELKHYTQKEPLGWPHMELPLLHALYLRQYLTNDFDQKSTFMIVLSQEFVWSHRSYLACERLEKKG
jgi:hypothetical protein